MFSSTPPPPKINWLCCMGDSMTRSDNTLSIPVDKQYPCLVKSAVGGYCREISLGIPGNTTTQMLTRISDMVKWGVPTVATIYGGINDQGSSITSATTQSNLQAMVNSLKNAGCKRIMLMNIHKPPSSDAVYDPYRTSIQNVATANNLPLCDLHAVTLVNPTDYYDVASNSIHLTASGLQKLANQIKAKLDELGWTAVLQS